MPKISYQEIVTPDISESGLILHEWNLSEDGLELCHSVGGNFKFLYVGHEAKQMWIQLCQSK